MTRKDKSKKQREREHQLAREEKKKEFEKLYYAEKKRWKEIGFDSWYEFDSLEEFVAKKLDEWESRQLKIPSGKYQDEKRIVSNYQQKFAEYIRQLCPQVFEELRELVPYFDNLFGEQKNKYIDIFSNYKHEIFHLDCSLQSEIDYSIIKDDFLEFRPNHQQNWGFDYTWGEYKFLFHLLHLLFVQEDVGEKHKALEDALQLLQDNLVVEHDCLNLPADFDISNLKNYVINQSLEIIKNFLLSNEQEFFREEAKRNIIKFLKDLSPTPETSLTDFIKLQVELLKWTERHNLKKDWLLRYAYFFLFQFSTYPNIKLSEIEILYLDIRSLYAEPFEFTFNGWSAADEEKENYEKRITEGFEAELQRYFHNVSRLFDLDSIKRITKPIDYNRVKWLVRWTVQGWSKEQIQEEIDKEFQNQGIEKYIDISTIDKAFHQFKKFDLPVKE
jgi:hypothetical protein